MRSAMRLVWTLDVRHLTAHRLRLVLSAFGIAAGVMLAVAVGALNSSISASLEAAAEAAASRANLEVRAATDAGMRPEVLDRVRGVEGVEASGATVEAYTRIRHEGRTERVLVMGFDQGILALSPRSVEPGALRAADPFGLMLPEPVASKLGVEAGDTVEVATATGWGRIGVGAVLPSEVAGRTRVAVGAIGIVGDLLGREGHIDAVYVEADDPTAVLPRLQAAISDGARAGPIAFREDQIRQLTASATASLSVATIVALFVGAFLVYNTMAMAAVERSREAATLRAVGARRRQVFALFVAEGGILGLAGSLLGMGAGVLLARALLLQRGSAVEDVLPIQVTDLTISAVTLAAAVAAGVAASAVAAMLPARRISRIDPAPALGPAGALEDPARAPRRASVLAGTALIVVGSVLGVIGYRQGGAEQTTTMAGLTLTLAGIALVIPTIVPAIARVVLGRLATARRAPGLWRLAAGEVLRSPGRTAFTVGAMLLALSLVVGFSIAQTSFTRAFESGFDEILQADLYVRSATWRAYGSDVPLEPEIGDELRTVPGVEIVFPFRVMVGTLLERTVIFAGFDQQDYARLPRLSANQRREATRDAELLADPGAVLVSDSFPAQFGLGPGDTIPLPTPTGTRAVRIAGTFPDPGAIIPEIFFDWEPFTEIWGTDGADSFEIGLAPGADVERVEAEIERRFADRLGVEADTREEFIGRINAIASSLTQLIASVQLVAVIVAGLGLANTLLISTLERRRDFGVLRAVGMLRRQVRRMVAAEAVLIGGLGVLLAWGLGTAIGVAMHRLVQAQMGMSSGLVLPAWAYGGALVLGLAGAVVASLHPAHRASRIDVVEALQYE